MCHLIDSPPHQLTPSPFPPAAPPRLPRCSPHSPSEGMSASLADCPPPTSTDGTAARDILAQEPIGATPRAYGTGPVASGHDSIVPPTRVPAAGGPDDTGCTGHPSPAR